jgi:lipid-binding SYLF domain-containing protein
VGCWLTGCAGIPPEERPGRRADVDAMAANTIAQVVTDNPSLQTELDAAVGFMAARLSSVSAPIVGGGSGLGVVVNNLNRNRTYVNVQRFDLSAAIGAQTYRVLLIFNDQEVMESFRSGRWQRGAGADAVAGTTGGTSVTGQADGFSIHLVADSGVLAGINLRLIRIAVNHDLTDTGISEITIPNRGFDIADGQEEGPRKWNRLLPFLAQRVVDRGYDLPLPLGAGLTYAYTEQDQLISDLENDFNGGEKTPINFVTFDEVISKSNTTQLKLDAWLLPFMNVFAMIGHVSGNAPVTFTLDGTTALEDLQEAGLIDCEPSGFPPIAPPLCNLLDGASVTLPIEANFNGTTYGLGTVLAGGWNGWFAAVPIVVTYADMDDTNTEGFVTTVSPRAGAIMGLGRWGNLAVYGGGQYINSKLDVDGTFYFGDTGLSVDYKIKQENKDPWTLLIGGNWDIDKHWSVSLEYSGFVGSREGVIAAASLRF